MRFSRRAVKHTSPFAPLQCRHRDVFSLEQLPEIVRLDVDVHMVAAAPERAVTRSPFTNAVVGTGRRTLDARKALRKKPRVVKTASGDLHFVGHTPSLLFQRSISARHRKKMTPDPRSAAREELMFHGIPIQPYVYVYEYGTALSGGKRKRRNASYLLNTSAGGPHGLPHTN